MHNPLLSAVEWFDDAVAGKAAYGHCQWRGPVVPSQRLGQANFISELLQDSHVRTSEETAGRQEATLPEPYTLEMADGTLVSFLLVRGSRKNMREIDVAKRAEKIAMRLAAYMSVGNGRSHSFGVYFLHDPYTANQIFEQKVAPMIATAKRLGGNATPFLNDLRSRLVHRAAEEVTLFTVRTHIAGMRREEMKQEQVNYRNLLVKIMQTGQGVKGLGRGIHTPFGQALISKSRGMLQRHEGLVNTILSDFNSREIGISSTLLALRETLELVQRFADREIRHRPGFTMSMFGGDKSIMSPLANHSAPTPLALGMQVLTRKVKGYADQVETAAIGNTWYGTTVLEEGPTSPRVNPSGTLFQTLMQKVRDAAIPIAIGFEILPNGLEYNRLNQFFNAMLGAIGSHNKQIRAAYKELRDHQEKDGKTDPVVGLRVTLSTWGPNKAVAEKSLLELGLAVNAWGGAKSNGETGSPDVARVTAIPEYSAGSLAPVLPAPLQDVVYLSPMMRPASPWDYGQLLFKTNDGVIYPVGIGTNKHTSYVTGIFAPSGFGKSFLTNRIHTCLGLTPGLQDLPFITNIDVAPSGIGFQRLLRCILPKELHGQIQYFKVLNHEDYCVNPWDTQLGCTQPTGPERDFITSVLEEVFDGMGEEAEKLIALLIDTAYEYYHPDSTTARIWQTSMDARVDKALERIGFVPVEGKTTVHMVVDKLFAAGKIEEAIIAQRYAVPRMEDLGKVLMTDQITRRYGTAKIPTGELLLEKATRDIANAVTAYPVFASVTRRDLDNARIKVIDLQQVLGGSSSSAIKFAGMMYMYARHLGARNYFLDVDEVRTISRPLYLEYQTKRVRDIQQTPKLLTYDEWHNVSRVKGLMNLNIKETRETRKFKVYVNFISQYASDAPDDILDGMTSIYVVGAPTPGQNKKLQEKLDLSDTDLDILNNGLNQMGRIWAYFKLRDGPVTAVLNNEVGPLETWCYTTDDKDAPLRNELEQLIGETEAVTLLAKEFPTGSAGAYLDSRSRATSAEFTGEKISMTTTVARELARKYNEALRNAADLAEAA